MKNTEEFSGKSSEDWTSRQKKDNTERVMGLGRRTREEIAKWTQMTALRFQMGEKSDIPGLPLGALKIVNQPFCLTLWLMIMHHNTKLGNKMFVGLEDIIWTLTF